eukprot:CAMPEP_0183788224 /NCGR_PEP_ID=MMETSP0739-20130205/67952_1 /TAXON_ID=385413 /ORGANISM="Thalassiosira miniscula, Strain CCMP1093" /LENGTH=68 /DNA_ID=CAMNT_0026032337 /DNA_START=636 /DNA_END=845 /DNA_ORIENTATION=-
MNDDTGHAKMMTTAIYCYCDWDDNEWQCDAVIMTMAVDRCGIPKNCTQCLETAMVMEIRNYDVMVSAA